MRIVACHTCWSWVVPQGGACPDCLFPVDPLAPDPAPPILQHTFGEFVTRLSVVRIERPLLPGWGALIGTTEGLLFLPFLTSQSDGALVPLQDESRWSMWQFWRSPTPSRFPVPDDPLPGDCDVVHEFFEAPGSLFIPRSHLVRFQLRSRQWAIARSLGNVVKFTPLSPPEEWQPAWRRLIADHAGWRTFVNL